MIKTIVVAYILLKSIHMWKWKRKMQMVGLNNIKKQDKDEYRLGQGNLKRKYQMWKEPELNRKLFILLTKVEMIEKYHEKQAEKTLIKNRKGTNSLGINKTSLKLHKN